MKYYLLSGMDKNNNYNFYKNIAERFREDLINLETLIYIPCYPDDRKKCKKLLKSEIFKNIGIKFKKVIVLNNYYSVEEIKKIINENKLIFLYGGNPYKQIDFLNKYEIGNLIKEKHIIGLSAGSINMCKNAICTRDEDFKESNMYKGLGLLDFSIEPHFDINNKLVLQDLKKYSMITDIYALQDDAFIIVNNKRIEFFGEVYLIKKGNINKIRKE